MYVYRDKVNYFGFDLTLRGKEISSRAKDGKRQIYETLIGLAQDRWPKSYVSPNVKPRRELKENG